ncbi:MAG TPA: NADH-quinone oxidoreductase subunit L [Burkholderiales bacterium]|nr:NADH-quinone oxidoreductase subunit L [Burkholderiales bacterium]
MSDLQLYLLVPLAPLAGAIVAGLGGRAVGRAGAHWVTIAGVAIAFAASCVIFSRALDGQVFNGPVYTWLVSGGTHFEIGFLIDRLSALMMVVVTFVSLMVHVYTIGYMADDPGYQRFFAYIALFTFSMLMLVMANNFLQLFFGWEAVGLVSYLLIGFWYTRPSAIYANLKAFLVNRVGDFGFLLAVALVLSYFGTLDYASVFSRAPSMAGTTIELVPRAPGLLLSAICIGLFVGAMGKSAQFPLHVWLPDSMEGPTPISALIHAATMVTAGIFMVARMSPLFELSDAARSMVLIVGGITAFFMALIAMVQYDIKRVVAYSTLSQLGYMTVALGASAYSVAIFHLMTHAFFKAVLFLGAGSVIIALHHEQDMRKMGGLAKYMPVTYLTVLIGALANAGFPPFAGFFSKDSIIEAVQLSHTFGAGFAWLAVLAGVFVGGFYSFRLVFYAFHGKPRFDAHHPPHESPLVVTVPLVLLAIPSVISGWVIGDVLFGGYFGSSIFISEAHPGVKEMAGEFHGLVPMMLHGLASPPFWLALAGAATAWYLHVARPEMAAVVRRKAGALVTVLEEKYYFDRFNDWFFAGGVRKLGGGLWRWGDVTLIDGLMVNGSAKLVGWFAGVARWIQSGLIYHYAFFMIIGVVALLWLFSSVAGR